MLEDVIKTKEIRDKIVSVLLYSIDKENYIPEDRHNHYYEIRVSTNLSPFCLNFYTDSEYYIKRHAIKAFNQVCNEIKNEKQT